MSRILINTKVTITEVKSNKYKAKVGEEDVTGYFLNPSSANALQPASLSLNDLKNKLGYLESNSPQVGTSWDVQMLAQPGLINFITRADTDERPYMITASELYSGENAPDDILSGAQPISFDTEDHEFKETEIIAGAIKDKLGELFGKVLLWVMDKLLVAIPDALQIGINTVSKIDTIEAPTANAEPEELTASYETIQADSKKNERAQVTTGDQNKGDPNKQTIVNVDAKDVKFSEETEIPIIPLDMYNIIYGKIDFLDVNFFNVDKTKHQEGSKWMYIRKIFAGALHIMLYLCSGFLIAVLIIHGIAIVKGTMIPEKKKEHIDGLRHFALALIMLVCSVLIMNLCIYGINFFTSYFGNETGGDAFIRVNIAGDTNYSFSANLTEFARFMTQINTVKKIGEKLMYIFIYGLLVLSNIATLLTMLIRSAMIVILSIQGPIVATAYSLDKKVFNMSYSEWVKKYLKWTSVQFILMILYRIIITLGKM